MDKTKWTWVLILFVIAFFLFWIFEREWKLESNHRYTVAVTTGYGSGGVVNFEFMVDGILYRRSDRGLSLKSRGAKYFVKYYTPDPSVLAKIVSSDEVPNCIGEPPPNGWADIPSCE
ncbi:MAG: hypothetical protein KF763_19910 [Cyclobacteriaceae bacterium]|nr:hypothetical protein [Cyclobacteriaceae bacterium]